MYKTSQRSLEDFGIGAKGLSRENSTENLSKDLAHLMITKQEFSIMSMEP